MNVQPNYDPSRFSYYVTDAFYSELVDDFSDWQTEDRAVTDAAERDRFRHLIEREARILDNLLFEDWLKLFAPECAYWVPSTPERGDPRREIAVMRVTKLGLRLRRRRGMGDGQSKREKQCGWNDAYRHVRCN